MNNPTQYGDNSIHIKDSNTKNVIGGSGNTFNNYEAPPPRTPTFPITNLVGQNPYFVGREAALQALTAATEPNAPATPLVIAGLGGVGKSQLLRHFGHQQRERFDIVWWVRVDETWGQEMLELGRQLCLPVDGLPLETALQMVRTWLNNCPQRWLLLCDNADATTAAQLHPLLPSHPQGRVLITSRTEDWGGVAQLFPLGTFVAAESDAFWRKRLGAKYQESEAWAELADALGYLPLALEHSAAYMLATGTRPADYVRLFREKRQALWGKTVPPPDYPATVATTWQVNFEAARETAGAAELLALCAFLAPVDLPLELLGVADVEEMPEGLRPVVADELVRNEAVAALGRYSLLQMGEDGQWGMHQLVQAVYRDQMGEAEEQGWVAVVVQWLAKVDWFDLYNMKTWPTAARLLPHLQEVVAQAEHWGMNNEEVGRLNDEIGYYLHQYAQLWEARPYLERALTIRKKLLGAEHPDTATSLNNLGGLLGKMGQFAEARQHYEHALAIRERMLGAEHPDTATSLNNMGRLLGGMGKLAEASPYLERALAIYEKVLGTEHPATGMSAGNLASIYELTGNLQEALPLRKQSLTIHEKALDENHPIIATGLNNMGILLQTMGKLVEAKPYYERALSICEKVLGAEHPDTANSLNNMGALLDEMGQLMEAEPYYQRALAICEKVLGAEHPETANSVNNLAILLAYMEDYPEAIRLMRRALTIREQKLGLNHPDTQSSRKSLAAMETQWNQF